MIVEKNVGIPMRDGALLMANIYRPEKDGNYPVLMCTGIYGKDVHFRDGYKMPWDALKRLYPNVDSDGSTGEYLRWEMADPDRWVPDDYILINIDSRGSGQTPGYLDPFSPTETADYAEAITWASEQPWSNGKVGLLGISYLSITQWQVAGLRPKGLAAICPWEGGSDLYRDWSHHGGILSYGFPYAWMPRQVLPNQHGNGATHHTDAQTGERTTGPSSFSADVLAGSRADHPTDLLNHPLEDEWYKMRSPKLERINVPVLSAGNWGGIGLHLRGNIEGYLRAGTADKWLCVHIGTHFESFYLPEYIKVQKKFFDRYLKGIANGWEDRKPVELEIRSVNGATTREEAAWPVPSTEWKKFHLDAGANSWSTDVAKSESKAEYRGFSDGVTFRTAPFEAETEFTGPVAAKLFVSSQTEDMDIFATMRLFDTEGNEVIFEGASEKVPVTRGWLRASHRKLDPSRSEPYRPFLTHDERQMLEPGKVYEVDLEIWPTSIVVPEGYQLALTLQGKDFEFDGLPGRMLHNSEEDRPAAIFDAQNTIYTGPAHPSYVLMPLIPRSVS